jgi:hypothetical protein
VSERGEVCQGPIDQAPSLLPIPDRLSIEKAVGEELKEPKSLVQSSSQVGCPFGERLGAVGSSLPNLEPNRDRIEADLEELIEEDSERDCVHLLVLVWSRRGG